jgi:TRAP-type C4-dicarboxylate transport system substrate-binding protein
MIDRRTFLAGAATAAVASPFVLRRAWAASPEFTLRLHHLLGPKSPAQVMMLQPFADRIFKDSDGRVKIDIYPAMSLGGAPPQLVRQVADGVVDIIWTVNGYTPGLFPRSEVFELPNLFTGDIAATNLAMHDMFDQYLADEFKNVHVLWLHVHAGQAIQMADKLVRKPEDFAGLKIRVPGPTGTDVIKTLGATPVDMPVPSLPQALTTHVVDGALIPWEIAPALKLQDVTKYDIEGQNKWRLGTTTFQVTMNQKSYDKLPADLKAVFDTAATDMWTKEVGDIWRKDDDGAIKILTDAGNEYVELTADETDAFRKALAPVVDHWVAARSGQIDAKGLVDAAKAAIAKHSA